MQRGIVRREFEASLQEARAPTKKHQDKVPLGSCSSMCSKAEITFRSKNHLIHPMETANPFINSKRSERIGIAEKMVKEYSRPAADKQVKLRDVRTFDVLVETVEYLNGLVDAYQADSQWSVVYPFVADRFRAVRQDLIVQQLGPQQTVVLLEAMIPFYLNGLRRCEVMRAKFYDRKLHAAELDECFSRWFEAVTMGSEFNEKILTAYVFYYLKKEATTVELLVTFGFTEENLRMVQDIIQFQNGNYRKFFDIYRKEKQDFIRSALWVYFAEFRLRALKTFRVAFGGRGNSFPIENLAELLHMNPCDVKTSLRQLFQLPEIVPTPFSFFNLTQKPLEPVNMSVNWLKD